MKIVIIEDELPNSRMLKGMIEKLRPEWIDITVLESVQESVEWFSTHSKPDLIFMDIQLSDGISFSIFEQVEISSLVIFTTAFNKYAIQAFKVSSIDYLLKPIKQEELENAIAKFERAYNIIYKNEEKPDYEALFTAITSGKKQYKQRFLIAGAKDYYKVNTSEIAFFYTQNRVTNLVTFDGKEHIIDYTMEKLEEILDPDVFFRANRSYILHIESIKKFENYFGGKLTVALLPLFNIKVEVSRLKASEFKKWFDK